MRVSITTTLYAAGRLEPVFAEASAGGADGFELQGHHTARLLAGAEDPARLAAQLDASGLRLAALMSGYLFDAATLEVHRRAAQLAADLGATQLPVLPPRHGWTDLAAFAALVRALAEHCEPLGVTVAVHHHAGTIVDRPERIDALLDAVDHAAVGLCFDTAHYALFADDEADAARRYAPRISHVHVKDMVRRRAALDFVPGPRNAASSFRCPGDGVLDVGGALRALTGAGYDGWLSIELENFNRPRPEAVAVGVGYVRRATR